jgi:serine/threonine-protein kinase
MVDTTVVVTQVDSTTKALDHLSAIDIADLLLASISLGWSGAITVEPDDSHVEPRHVIRGQRGEPALVLATIKPALADAVVARLAILARLAVGVRAPQIGRVRVRIDGATGSELGLSSQRGVDLPSGAQPRARLAEVFLATRATPGGLVAELRRIAAPGERAAAPRPRAIVPSDGGSMRFGNYRVVAELGRGGMGIVYRAEHVVLRKPVAIKVLSPDLAGLASLDAQFVVEARAACRARHPSIIDVTDFGELPDGRSFLVMELVEWETLDVRLKRGPFTADRALRVAREVASALAVAADHGVVHRDLKPSNIFVSPEADLRVKIGDFGVACVIGEGESQRGDALRGRIMGTAAYMSPEQALSARGDPRNDLYSLGCVLFEMLTGREPYRAPTLAAVLDAHASEPIPPVIGPSGAVPEPVERVVRRAMAKRIEERYQSAPEMLADIDRALAALSKDGWRRWLPE